MKKKKQSISLTKRAKLIIAGFVAFTLILASGMGYQAYKTDTDQKMINSKKPSTAKSEPSKQTNQTPITIDPTKKEQTINVNGKQIPITVTTEKKTEQKEQKQ
jgi:hypothetical protein